MTQQDEKLSLLRHVECFQGMDTAELKLIAQQMTEMSYKDGEVVVREGDPGDRMFLLMTGAMQVQVEREGNTITYGKLDSLVKTRFEEVPAI